MKLAQAVRFAIVGGVQNGANLATFVGLHAAGASYAISAVVGALAGLLVSFLMNRRWTFAAASSARLGGDLLRYTVVFTTAVLVGLVLLTIQVELLGVAAVAAQAVAILIVAPASFLVQRTWVFGAGGRPANPESTV